MSSDVRSEEDQRRRKSLDLSDQGLTYFNPQTVLNDRNVNITHIKRLVLVDNTLSVVPNSISSFVNLEELDVSRNFITWLSGEVARLPKLKIFIARNNRLRTLPKELEEARTLEILNLSGNLFLDIPREIIGLHGLKELYFGGNLMKSVTDEIERLNGLQVLYLGGNQIESIPDSFGNLRNLQALILCDNKLENIPRKLAQLNKLKSLSLHKNRLKTLPMEIVMLLNLQELSLRDNPLVDKFARDFDFNPPSLMELSGRAVKIHQMKYDQDVLPRVLVSYLDSAKSCVNPQCKGVYFDSRVRCLKFVDFCGQYRLPLEQYLCSPHFNSCINADDVSVPARKIQKLLLPQN